MEADSCLYSLHKSANPDSSLLHKTTRRLDPVALQTLIAHDFYRLSNPPHPWCYTDCITRLKVHREGFARRVCAGGAKGSACATMASSQRRRYARVDEEDTRLARLACQSSPSLSILLHLYLSHLAKVNYVFINLEQPVWRCGGEGAWHGWANTHLPERLPLRQEEEGGPASPFRNNRAP